MKNLGFARSMSIVCMVGAVVQIIYGLLTIPFPFYDPNSYYGWDEALWVVVTVGMIGSVLGLLTLDVVRPRWLALVGAVLSVLGNLLRIIAAVWNIAAPANGDAEVPLILLSILLLLLGMGALGVGTLVGRQLRGWQAWLPLLTAGCILVIAPLYSINLPLHFLLLGLWGIPWLLLGFTVFRSASNQQPVALNKVSMGVPR
jgi:ABC-type Na+ efflux pump permease subunit